MRYNTTFDARFQAKVELGPWCWEWRGKRLPRGYGRLSNGRRCEVYAHRYAWERVNGPVPEGLLVLHTCDNPGCVNPAHLFVGTFGDNNRDTVAKGRHYTPFGRGPRCRRGHEFCKRRDCA